MWIRAKVLKEWGMEGGEKVMYGYTEPRDSIININKILFVQDVGDDTLLIALSDYSQMHIKGSMGQIMKLLDDAGNDTRSVI